MFNVAMMVCEVSLFSTTILIQSKFKIDFVFKLESNIYKLENLKTTKSMHVILNHSINIGNKF